LAAYLEHAKTGLSKLPPEVNQLLESTLEIATLTFNIWPVEDQAVSR